MSSSPRRPQLIGSFALIVGLLSTAVGGTVASAAHGPRAAISRNGGCTTPADENVAGFAIDGNIQRQCSDTNDWADGPGGAGLVTATRNGDGTCTNTGADAEVICDGVKGNDQSVFGGGDKESDPCDWTIASAPPPPNIKDDITNAYVSAAQPGGHGTDVWGLVGMERVGVTNNPSRDLDVEFNQEVAAGPSGQGIPIRMPGDIQVSVDSGGSNGTGVLNVFVAKTKAQDSNVTTCGGQTAGYDYAHPDISMSFGSNSLVTDPGLFTGAINSSTISCGSWDCYDDKYNLVTTLPAGDFFEIGIDLTQVLKNAGLTPSQPCITGNVMFRTRTSGDDVKATAQLKDVVNGILPPALCGHVITAARVSRFRAVRHGSHVNFSWRTATSSGIAGFSVYAGSHRLDTRLIAAHPSSIYHYRAKWAGRGSFYLKVLMTNGSSFMVAA